ncbi:MAG: hypothetical protein R2932_59090 [Caldilineaceae bacterium]
MLDLERYGVKIVPVSDRGIAYRLTGIEKLSGEENRGAHNIFVCVFDANGDRLRTDDLRIRAVIAGNDIVYKPLDKPDTAIERGHGDIPMAPGSRYSVSIIDTRDHPSDVVTGLRSDYPDEEPGSTWGHHSFRLEFTLTGDQSTGPVEPPTEGEIDRAALRAWLAEADDLMPQLGDWLARGNALVGN